MTNRSILRCPALTRLVLLQLMLFSCSIAGAQTWSQTSLIPGADDGRALIPTSDGGFIVASSLPNDVSCFTRLDAHGAVVWTRSYAFRLHDVKGAVNGGLIASGLTWQFAPAAVHEYVVALSSAGTELWARGFPAASVFHTALDATPDGGCLFVTGETRGLGVHKLDNQGAPQWHRSLTISHACANLLFSAQSVVRTSAGDYVISGNYIDLCQSLWSSPLTVFALDAQGARLWTKTRYGSGPRIATPGGGHVDVGATPYHNPSLPLPSSCGWISQADANGNLLWARAFYGPQLSQSFISDVITLPSGGFLGCGSIRTTSLPNQGAQGWLFELDAVGTLLWERDYGGAGEDAFRSLGLTSNGGIAVVGVSNSYSSENDTWTLLLDASGNLDGTCPSRSPGNASYISAATPVSSDTFQDAPGTLGQVPGPQLTSTSISFAAQCSGCFAGVVPIGGSVGGSLAFAHTFSCHPSALAVTWVSLTGMTQTLALPGGFSIQLDYDAVTQIFLESPIAFSTLDAQGQGTTVPLPLPNDSGLIGTPYWVAASALDLQNQHFVATTPRTQGFFLR